MRAPRWALVGKVVRMALVGALLIVAVLLLSWRALGGPTANHDSAAADHGMRLVHSSEENFVATRSAAADNSFAV